MINHELAQKYPQHGGAGAGTAGSRSAVTLVELLERVGTMGNEIAAHAALLERIMAASLGSSAGGLDTLKAESRPVDGSMDAISSLLDRASLFSSRMGFLLATLEARLGSVSDVPPNTLGHR